MSYYFLFRNRGKIYDLKLFNYFPRSRKYCYNFNNMSSKPPNILIYTGSCNDDLFKIIKHNISLCLEPNRYVIYHLLPKEIENQPWMENSTLLCVCSDFLPIDVKKLLERYVQNFGSLFLICSRFDTPFNGFSCVSNTYMLNTKVKFRNNFVAYTHRGKYNYSCDNSLPICWEENNKPVIHKTLVNGNIFIASEVYIDRDLDIETNRSLKFTEEHQLVLLKSILSEDFGLRASTVPYNLPKVSPGYIFSKTNNFDKKTNEQTIFFVCKLEYNDCHEELPIYFADIDSVEPSFNIKLFFSNLKTDLFGHYLIHFDVISSTMDVTAQLLLYEGITAVANCQVSGRGRGGNEWIGCKGCAMFTLYFTVPFSSPLGQKLSLLQHLACLAVVHGIRKRIGYSKLDINIKWPNDIYYNRDKKIGGLIVTTTVREDKAFVHIGWAVNVSNRLPTVCINDVIENFNLQNNSDLPFLNVEEIIASTLTELESLINNFNEFGANEVLSLYYLYWMHGNQKINIYNSKQEGFVSGIDDYGYLIVEIENKQKLTLHPDGNRFDIMKNMIYSK